MNGSSWGKKGERASAGTGENDLMSTGNGGGSLKEGETQWSCLVKKPIGGLDRGG